MRKLLTVVSLITLLQSQAYAGFCGQWLGRQQAMPQPMSVASELIVKYKTMITAIVSKASENPDPNYPTRWSCDYGSCIAMSAQLLTALKTYQMPIERVEVNSLFKIFGHDLPTGAFHFFLVDRSISGQEIIIDSTYKQFFYQNISEPDIFVGTRKELEQLFLRHRDNIKPQNADDAKRALDPVGVVEVIYGYGRGEKTNRNEPARVQSAPTLYRPPGSTNPSFSSNLG